MVIEPRRAVVTPRARAAPDGEPLPLDGHVRRLLDRGAAGVVNVFGPPGSGKTTALQHLAAVLGPARTVTLLDANDDVRVGVTPAALKHLVVLATRRRTGIPHLAAFSMAPWTVDDAIEYLLATRPDRCASVMARLKDVGLDAMPGGAAELWRVVLDQMIAGDAVATPTEALRHDLAARLGDERTRRRVTARCLRHVLGAAAAGDGDVGPPAWYWQLDPALARLVEHAPVQLLLAAQRIVWDVASGKARQHLHRALPDELLAEVASLARFRPPVWDELNRILGSSRERRAHPTAASILHAAGTGWRPAGCKPNLSCARLAGARWEGVDLAGADLSAARLAGADLRGAKLEGARLDSADLAGATLRGAALRRLHATNATFDGADLATSDLADAGFLAASLRGADLWGANLRDASLPSTDLTSARLRGATLTGACFHGAKLDGADLRGADLTSARLTSIRLRDSRLAGAIFFGARLLDCDLQDVELPPGAMFRGALLTHCDLAGSVMPGADLRGANLQNAGLAFVGWEGADLRGADLHGARFHTGSSRSGLVGSTIASEGSRTGFYTDDYDDRAYKPPEEIRKANLCGADLRGAAVDGADFYLVDLRRARYTRDQAEHFRRCGAIL